MTPILARLRQSLSDHLTPAPVHEVRRARERWPTTGTTDISYTKVYSHWEMLWPCACLVAMCAGISGWFLSPLLGTL